MNSLGKERNLVSVKIQMADHCCCSRDVLTLGRDMLQDESVFISAVTTSTRHLQMLDHPHVCRQRCTGTELLTAIYFYQCI